MSSLQYNLPRGKNCTVTPAVFTGIYGRAGEEVWIQKRAFQHAWSVFSNRSGCVFSQEFSLAEINEWKHVSSMSVWWMLFREKKKLYKSSEIKSAKDIWQVKKKYGEIEQYQEQNLNMLKETMSTGGNFPWGQGQGGSGQCGQWTGRLRSHLLSVTLAHWFWGWEDEGEFAPRAALNNGDTFGCHSRGGKEAPLASSGWRSGMLLSIPEGTGQAHTTKNYLALKVSDAAAWNPALAIWILLLDRVEPGNVTSTVV